MAEKTKHFILQPLIWICNYIIRIFIICDVFKLNNSIRLFELWGKGNMKLLVSMKGCIYLILYIIFNCFRFSVNNLYIVCEWENEHIQPHHQEGWEKQ